MLAFLTVTYAVAVVLASAYEGPRADSKNIQWTGGSFDWPCPTTKALFKNGGKYIPKNILATRGAIFKDDAILALPRYKAGVPATLARVSLKSAGPSSRLLGAPGAGGAGSAGGPGGAGPGSMGGSSPPIAFSGCQAVLSAFPCWTLQEEGNCNALQNVVDVFIDSQDILWALDTGVVNSLEEPIKRCPPKAVAINVKTGKLVKTVDLSGLTTPTSRPQYIVADYSPDGRAFIYVADAATRSILVYDVTSGRGYRVVLPKAVTLGCSRRDVLYMALLRRPDGSNCLAFSYLSSSRLFSIRTEHLQNGSTCGKIHDLGPKPKKMVMLGTDNGSAMFFRPEGDPDIYRWDSNTPFHPGNFQKVYKGNDCSLATQVIPDYKRGRMRVLESNFPDYMQGTVGCGANQALNLM